MLAVPGTWCSSYCWCAHQTALLLRIQQSMLIYRLQASLLECDVFRLAYVTARYVREARFPVAAGV